ncbi:MAG: nuclear transport factor 2 family protein [Sphingobium sp.]|uniref:nuclear transport factor 2 family protein n=1 Tax=Sphingobium sp. TaxID=1912891 RepID=UPI0029B2E4E2|nr:nuclear transport factor 2 family protein [Sphingobium sp.]MDX3911695.1 nuclear transport factor 2 family protein [Sphingobium sp.]
MSQDVSPILALEQRRCAAINAQDIEEVGAVLADDYQHIHASGQIDDRETYINSLKKAPRHSERGELNVRVYGDVAVVVGDQINTFDGRQSTLVVQQIAVAHGGNWQFVSTQLTRKVDH